LVAAARANRFENLEKLLVRPPAVDLRPSFPQVYDQGDTNTCTACAAAAMIAYLRREHVLPALDPSRLFLYFYDQKINGLTNPKSGGSVLAALTAANRNGYCSEGDWPFTKGNLGTTPSMSAQAAAQHHKGTSPVPINSLDALLDILATGYPVGVSLLIFNSFYSADDRGGVVQMPGANEGYTKHAGAIVGYRPDGYLIFRSSWGLNNPDGGPCGDQGHYYLPSAYFQGNLNDPNNVVSEGYAIENVMDS
jgi:C1A family cysteine protease